MKVNIKEIARRAGVSTATVSRTLNGNGPVKDETRRRILQIAREFNYKPNPIARGLSSHRTDTIGVILPELVDEFFMNIIHSIDEAAYEANRYVMISSSHTQRNVVETLLEFMGSGRVDGVILMVPKMQKEIQDILKKSRRPIVLLNAIPGMEEISSITFDNYQGARAVTQHLIEHGYQQIAMIKGPEGNIDAEERFRGFREAIQDAELPFNDRLIIEGDFTSLSGFYGFMRLISQPSKPDAIFAANDMIALGIYDAARKANIHIPHDIGVVGFDDIYPASLVIPRLTTVHIPVMELGRKAVRLLLKLISGEVAASPPHHELLTTGLVIGGSCGCNTPDTEHSF